MSKYFKLTLWHGQYKSFFYRIYTNIMIFLGFSIVPLFVNRKFLAFWYKGDEIYWLWSWYKKEQKERFISLNFTGNGDFGDMTFNSLKEIDKAWKEYFDACP